MKKINQEDVIEQLLKFPEWRLENGCLTREFKFTSFAQSVAFFNCVARIAEKLNHHPDLFNSYTYCQIKLMTHDCNGISDLDFEFIRMLAKDLLKEH